MATYTRRNAWNNGGTFSNTDLLWYAKGVGVMQSRQLDDPNSWWFYAAIHGYYLDGGTTFPDWSQITGPPNVPSSPKPTASVIGKYWEQCQHQSWYFLPWHRGYLIALEQQIRAAIKPLGGPTDWALPYWNYFGGGDQYKMPPAFTQQALPDGSLNPLFVKLRHGPKYDDKIYIKIPPDSQDCQRNTIFTGSNAATSLPGYGGPKTGFWPGGGTSGNLESNPHNKIHVDVGGFLNESTFGLMSDPGTAGLDPIFYLHHCNIDRMWASWNVRNPNPTAPDWLNGPTATQDRKFVMPMPGNNDWYYTPKELESLGQLDYDYERLDTITQPRMNQLVQRLSKFGVSTTTSKQDKAMDNPGNSEMVGANEGALRLTTEGARTTVKLEPNAWKQVPERLMKASFANVPDHIYLQIENVRGKIDGNSLNVSVNHRPAGSISLFGLRKASNKDSHHGGAGLTFILDITDIVDDLFLNKALDANSLDVLIQPTNAVHDNEVVTIGRISLYREEQA